MRVMHIGKYFAPYAGGIENFLLDLVQCSQSKGINNAVLVHQSPGTAAGFNSNPSKNYPEWLYRERCFGQLLYAPVSPGFGRSMARLIGQFKPDILHFHLPNTSAFWALSTPVARRLPWLVHWHADVIGPGLEKRLAMLYPIYRPFEQRLLERSERIITTSPAYLAGSKSLSRWRDRSEVIPLGLNCESIRTTAPYQPMPWRQKGHLRVLAIGRLAGYKGFEHLIKAIALTDNVELVLAGEGPRRKFLQRTISDQNSGQKVHLIGAVDNHLRNQLLATCDLLCLPSINRAEAFGLCLLEAMAAGKPAIVSNIEGSGTGWVIDNEKTGWLVPVGDAQSIANVLAFLTANRRRVLEAGARAKAEFTRHFRIDAVANQFVELYRKIATESRVSE